MHHLYQDSNFSYAFASLAADGSPADCFSANAESLTLPGSNLAGFRRGDDGCPVVVYQVNFNHGDVILTIDILHICGDAKSIGHTFELLTASKRAILEDKSARSSNHHLMEYISELLQISAAKRYRVSRRRFRASGLNQSYPTSRIQNHLRCFSNLNNVPLLRTKERQIEEAVLHNQ